MKFKSSFLLILLLIFYNGKIFSDEMNYSKEELEAISRSKEILKQINTENYTSLVSYMNSEKNFDFIVFYARDLYIKSISVSEYETLLKSDSREKFANIPGGNELKKSLRGFMKNYICRRWDEKKVNMLSPNLFYAMINKHDEYQKFKYDKDILVVDFESSVKNNDFNEYFHLYIIFTKNQNNLCFRAIMYEYIPDMSVSSVSKKFKLSSDKAKSMISEKGGKVLGCLKFQKWSELAQYIHPKKGLIITIFPEIKKTSPHFTKDDFKDKNLGERIIDTGIYPATDDPRIHFNFALYISHYFCTMDYLVAPEINYNHLSNSMTHINRWFLAFPDAVNVEYYFPEKGQIENKEIQTQCDVDWWSMQLYFEEFNKEYYLVCIVNDSSSRSKIIDNNYGIDE